MIRIVYVATKSYINKKFDHCSLYLQRQGQVTYTSCAKQQVNLLWGRAPLIYCTTRILYILVTIVTAIWFSHNRPPRYTYCAANYLSVLLVFSPFQSPCKETGFTAKIS